jgi:hypothetical protein
MFEGDDIISRVWRDNWLEDLVDNLQYIPEPVTTAPFIPPTHRIWDPPFQAPVPAMWIDHVYGIPLPQYERKMQTIKLGPEHADIIGGLMAEFLKR